MNLAPIRKRLTWHRMRPILVGGSGPQIARVFFRLLALNLIFAWWSLVVQIRELVGRDGLLPWDDYIARATKAGVGFFDAPSIFYWGATDAWLVSGCIVGLILALSLLLGFLPRLCVFLSLPLYLSYIVCCRAFLHFQWDSMLIECCFLALFLPRDQRATTIHILFKFLLVKLYVESAIAKLQSHLGDWLDGSAMEHYYETAPIPGFLAWHFHNLPDWWHQIETWVVVYGELLLPVLIFTGRKSRLGVFVTLTVFQLINVASANYGFFCYLTLALHVFLLDDRDIESARTWFTRRFSVGKARVLQWMELDDASTAIVIRRPRLSLWTTRLLAVFYIGLSASMALSQFAGFSVEPFSTVEQAVRPLRLVNNYHLFGHITRVRIEPQFETLEVGGGWRERLMRHKPGHVDELPGFIAPHQPRVDFRLWFHGLNYMRRRQYENYVVMMLRRICQAPYAVQGLFASELPEAPRSVRVRYWKYKMTTWDQHTRSGQRWWREAYGTGRVIHCRSL